MACQVQVDVIGQVDGRLPIGRSPVLHPDLSGHRAEAVPGEHVEVPGIPLESILRITILGRKVLEPIFILYLCTTFYPRFIKKYI
jgi:hypothetical protein